MNNDLEQFREERLMALSRNSFIPWALRMTTDERMSLASIALQSKKAKTMEVLQFIVNNHEKDWYIEWADCNQEYFDSVSKDHRRVLYTTQNVCLEDKEGWRLAPEEATIAMLTLLGMTGSFEFMQQKYKNMLAAAPKPESE